MQLLQNFPDSKLSWFIASLVSLLLLPPPPMLGSILGSQFFGKSLIFQDWFFFLCCALHINKGVPKSRYFKEFHAHLLRVPTLVMLFQSDLWKVLRKQSHSKRGMLINCSHSIDSILWFAFLSKIYLTKAFWDSQN